MKVSRSYVWFIVVAILVCFAASLRMPRQFVWKATFLSSDRQPFGCYVFDSIMAQTLPNGYSVSRRTFSQIASDTADSRKNILVLSDDASMGRIDFRAMDSLLRRGSKVTIAYCGTRNELADSIMAADYGFCIYSFDLGFSVASVKRALQGDIQNAYGTVQWCAADRRYLTSSYRMYSQMVSGFVLTDKSRSGSVRYDTLVSYTLNYIYPYMQCPYFPSVAKRIRAAAHSRKDTLRSAFDCYQYYDEWHGKEVEGGKSATFALAATRKVGRGELTVVSIPYIYTNYGVLSPDVSPLLMRLMTQMADRPVLRTTSYMKTDADIDAEMSPMRYILSQKPLRHAYWLLLSVLLLFCVFKARRRQRIIPVIAPPANYSLEFARLVGTLYWQRGDNADLLRKKFRLFAERLRTVLMVDVVASKPDAAAIALIARRTAMPPADVAAAIDRLRLDYWTEGTIDDREMRWAIDIMDRMMRLI